VWWCQCIDPPSSVANDGLHGPSLPYPRDRGGGGSATQPVLQSAAGSCTVRWPHVRPGRFGARDAPRAQRARLRLTPRNDGGAATTRPGVCTKVGRGGMSSSRMTRSGETGDRHHAARSARAPGAQPAPARCGGPDHRRVRVRTGARHLLGRESVGGPPGSTGCRRPSSAPGIPVASSTGTDRTCGRRPGAVARSAVAAHPPAGRLAPARGPAVYRR